MAHWLPEAWAYYSPAQRSIQAGVATSKPVISEIRVSLARTPLPYSGVPGAIRQGPLVLTGEHKSEIANVVLNPRGTGPYSSYNRLQCVVASSAGMNPNKPKLLLQTRHRGTRNSRCAGLRRRLTSFSANHSRYGHHSRRVGGSPSAADVAPTALANLSSGFRATGHRASNTTSCSLTRTPSKSGSSTRGPRTFASLAASFLDHHA